ncbi:MAG: aldo/keto reductase [Armatimonadota bacterium]
MVRTEQFRGMKCRQVGNSGLWVSEIGLGLWKYGYPEYDSSRVGEHKAFQILDRALELGVFFWDTANSYSGGAGNSERVLGRYFSSRPQSVRDQVVLATKVTNPVRDEHELGPYPDKTGENFTPNQRGASRLYIIGAVDDCLERLQVDHIDLLYLHNTTLFEDGEFECPLDETWSTMDDLISDGKVRYIGVSNHSADQLDQTMKTLSRVGKDTSRRIIAVQNCYNLVERSNVAAGGDGDDEEFLSFLKNAGPTLVPYFPLAAGLLTGRYSKDDVDDSGRLAQEEAMGERFLTERNLAIVEGISEIAEEKGCSMAQLAIAWLLSKKEVSSVIAGVTKLEHLEDNAGAINVELSNKDLETIDELTK